MFWGKKDTPTTKNSNSAKCARERLQIIIIEDRKRQTEERDAKIIDRIKQDILASVSRYIRIEQSDVEIIRSQQNDQDILELNVNIQDKEFILNPDDDLAK